MAGIPVIVNSDGVSIVAEADHPSQVDFQNVKAVSDTVKVNKKHQSNGNNE